MIRYVTTSEEWKLVPRLAGVEVSSHGRIKNAGKILNPGLDNLGYRRAYIYVAGKRVNERVHVLVCEAFHGPRPSPSHDVAHQDGTRANNVPSNLRWATRKENVADTFRHGRAPIGDRHKRTKISDANVLALIAEHQSSTQRHGILKRLAAKYGIKRGTVMRILYEKSRQCQRT